MMKVMVTCGLGILLIVGASPGRSQDGETKDDLAKLKGKWTFEKDGKNLNLEFDKNEFTISFEEKVFKGTFKIDPKKKPKEMDLTIMEGERFQGQTSFAIYEIDGDKLKWCACEPGKGNRAVEFPAEPGEKDGFLYLILMRVK